MPGMRTHTCTGVESGCVWFYNCPTRFYVSKYRVPDVMQLPMKRLSQIFQGQGFRTRTPHGSGLKTLT